jgi:hypothetical protein
MYEENALRNPDILQLAKQLYTPQSIIRILPYKKIDLPPDINQNYVLLQIKDKEFKMSEQIDRNFECEYKMLANEFLKSVQMTRKKKAIVFIQSSPESEKIGRKMFKEISSQPDMIIYRTIEVPSAVTTTETIPNVIDVVVKDWKILSSLAARFLREICEGT